MENEVEKSPQYKSGLGSKLAISNLDYPKFNKEIKKILKSTKQYKDIIENIQLYLEKQRIKLCVSEKITLNRKMLYCCNKLLKQQVVDGEYDKNAITMLMEKAQRYIFESYRFINLYICKVMPNRLKTAIFSDASFLTSEDEYKSQKLHKKKIKTIDELNTQYDFHPELVRQKKKAYHEFSEYEKCDAYRINQILENELLSENPSNPKVEIGYELTQYFMNLVRHFMNLSYVYKSHRLKPPKLKIAYHYLQECERIMDKIAFSADPDILQLAAKVKIALSTFYFEAGRSEMALQKIEEALLFSQFDIHLNFVSKRKSKQEKKQLFSIKLLLFILNIQAMICQDLKQYQRMYEAMTLADYMNQKTLQKVKKLDDLAKFTQKQVSVVQNYQKYLEEEAEIQWIAEQQLGVPLAQLKRIQVEKIKEQVDLRNQNFVKSQVTLFDKFTNKSLLNHHHFSYKFKGQKPPKISKATQKKKEQEQQKLIEEFEKKQFREDDPDMFLHDIKDNNNINTNNNTTAKKHKEESKEQENNDLLFDQLNNQNQKNFDNFHSNKEPSSQNQPENHEKHNYLGDSDTQNLKPKKINQSESNIEKKTQLSFSFDSQSDDGFFNESFFAPSLDNEAEWKSNIQNSVKQSFQQKQSDFKKTSRLMSAQNHEYSKSHNTTKMALGNDQTHFKSQQFNKQSEMFSRFEGSQSSKSLRKLKPQNPNQNLSHQQLLQQKEKEKKKVTIDYPNIRYKQKIKISNYFKPGHHSEKPKVLTTNEYFQKRTNTESQKRTQQDMLNRKNNPAIKNEIKFKQIMKNIENKDNWQYSGLDELIYDYVDKRILDENKFISMNLVHQNTNQFGKMDQFDKNEFPYCRKMLHQKMLEGLKITTPQINFSDKPNQITMKGLVVKDVNYYNKKHFFEVDMAMVNHQKNLKKIDRIYDKQLDIDLGQEELELMKLKQEANKKKDLQEIIYKHKDHKLFEQAKQLKELYKKYEENKQQKLKDIRRQKEKELRDQENNLILQKEEQLKQQQQQQQNPKLILIREEHRRSIITDQMSTVSPRNDDNLFNFQGSRDSKQVKFDAITNSVSDTIREESDKKQKKDIQDLKSKSKSQKEKPRGTREWISEQQSPKRKIRTASEDKFRKPLLLNDIMASTKQDRSMVHLENKDSVKNKIDSIQKKTEYVNKIISTQVDVEKWNNVELLKLSRIKLGKEKPQKEDMYDFNKGFASRFKDLRISLQGISQKTQFADNKRFFTFADMVQAKIQSQRKRNLIMGQGSKQKFKDSVL